MHDVVLVDDQVLFVESLRNVIQSRSDDFRVVGVFYDAESALRSIRDLEPDLVLMDVRMPGTDGVQATRRVLERTSRTRVVMLTTYEEDDYVRQAVKQGAVGYLLKDMPPDALLSSMRSAISGQFQIPSKLANRFIGSAEKTENRGDRASREDTTSEPEAPGASGFAEEGGAPGSSELPDWLYELSRKERMILRLVVEGYENDEIAERVFLAPQTVKNYISRLYSKAAVDSRPHLMKVARNLLEYL